MGHTQYLGLIDTFVDDSPDAPGTIYHGAEIGFLHRTVDSLAVGALQTGAGGSGVVLPFPNANSFLVTAGAGLSVSAAPGQAAARSVAFGALMLESAAPLSRGALTPNATLNIFVVGTVPDSRACTLQASPLDTLDGGVLLARVVTGDAAVLSVVSLRRFPGDMARAVYDPDGDGKVSLAVRADSAAGADGAPWTGVTGKPATFPPSAHSHDAAAITSGTMNRARLPLLTGATAVAPGAAGLVPGAAAGEQDKALFGDGTWRTPAAPAAAARSLVTLDPHDVHLLKPHTNYRISVDFSELGVFTDAAFAAHCTCDEDGVIILQEHNNATPGRASFTLYVPSDATAGSYGNALALRLTVVLAGVGWTGATVAGAGAWSLPVEIIEGVDAGNTLVLPFDNDLIVLTAEQAQNGTIRVTGPLGDNGNVTLPVGTLGVFTIERDLADTGEYEINVFYEGGVTAGGSSATMGAQARMLFCYANSIGVYQRPELASGNPWTGPNTFPDAAQSDSSGLVATTRWVRALPGSQSRIASHVITASEALSGWNFTAVPQGFTDLIATVTGCTTASNSSLYLRLNNYAGGGGYSAGGATAIPISNWESGANMAMAQVRIFNYANTQTPKAMTVLGYQQSGAHRYNADNAAISSLQIFNGNGANFTAGTRLDLYGIK